MFYLSLSLLFLFLTIAYSSSSDTGKLFDSMILFDDNLEHLFVISIYIIVVLPMKVPNQLVGAPLSTDVTLICNVEASPKAINYWQRENGKIIECN
jgi:hypothetical protein